MRAQPSPPLTTAYRAFSIDKTYPVIDFNSLDQSHLECRCMALPREANEGTAGRDAIPILQNKKVVTDAYTCRRNAGSCVYGHKRKQEQCVKRDAVIAPSHARCPSGHRACDGAMGRARVAVSPSEFSCFALLLALRPSSSATRRLSASVREIGITELREHGCRYLRSTHKYVRIVTVARATAARPAR